MKLTKDDVLHIANLAKIKLSEEEIEGFQLELSQVIDYMKVLDEAKVDDVKPYASASDKINTWRNDDKKIDYDYKKQDLIDLAPSVKDNYWQVKAVLNNDNKE